MIWLTAKSGKPEYIKSTLSFSSLLDPGGVTLHAPRPLFIGQMVKPTPVGLLQTHHQAGIFFGQNLGLFLRIGLGIDVEVGAVGVGYDEHPLVSA